jgi:hypothetical protein
MGRGSDGNRQYCLARDQISAGRGRADPYRTAVRRAVATGRPAGPAGSQGSRATASPAETWQPDGEGFKRIFHTVGGDVEFFTGKDAVQVASSTPKTGYTVNVTRYGGDSVMVSFFGNR